MDKRDYRLGNDRPRESLAARTASSSPRSPPSSPSLSATFQPRFIRLRDAPSYFGMDKNRFNREIRRLLTQIRIGRQGIAFDLLEMEAAAEDYKNRNGVPVAQSERSKPSWENSEYRVDVPPLSVAVGSRVSRSL